MTASIKPTLLPCSMQRAASMTADVCRIVCIVYRRAECESSLHC